MNESVSLLRGHALRLALLGTGTAVVWAALTLLIGTLSPASADTEDAPPALLATSVLVPAASTLLPALPAAIEATDVDTTAVATTTIQAESPVATLVAEATIPLVPIITPLISPLITPMTNPVIALVSPVTSFAAPATSLLDPVATSVPLLAAMPAASATESIATLPRLGASLDRPAEAAASAVLAPLDSPVAPTPPAPASPAVLPGSSASAAGGHAPEAATDLPSGRSNSLATPGVLARVDIAVLPLTPTFDPGSTPD